MTIEPFDVIVIGAGMAGASVACELAPHLKVVVLERESAPGYHATGRSAALFSEIYGAPPVRALSRGSRPFLAGPPSGFGEPAMTRRRGCLFPADADNGDFVERLAAEEPAAVHTVSAAVALAMAPILRPEACVTALVEPDSYDLDVDALLQGYLRGALAAGAQLVTGAGVAAISREGGHWRVEAAGRTFEASVLVDAAGAWADQVGEMAGARPLGLSPGRRTVILTDPPPDEGFSDWPCVIDAAETYYFKPDAGRLLISPADETPSQPCDAQPEELDVAIAVDRFERATTWAVKRISHRWAGLRTFTPDRVPAIGWDAHLEGFFWLAGQGGYGVQTAPAAAQLAGALVRGEPPPARLLDHGVNPADYAPARLSRFA